MKTKIEVQFQERNIDVKDTEKLVKENLKAAGVKNEHDRKFRYLLSARRRRYLLCCNNKRWQRAQQ